MKTLKSLIEDSQPNVRDFSPEFDAIIFEDVMNYDQFAGEDKASLRSFLEDLQKGGCVSGMINEFIYHADCKEFYIKHIDALEDYKTEIEEMMGEPIKNRQELPHYTFVVWLCFEEYCNDLYRAVFED